jgi:hypothetical protein
MMVTAAAVPMASAVVVVMIGAVVQCGEWVAGVGGV